MNESEAKAFLQLIYDSTKSDEGYIRIAKLKWMIDEIKWYIVQIEEGKA